ncbi:MAG: phosphotriesterase-related protein [Actinomycetota bacterium]|nr:phosphotriesterase-related protein [Actinomycetota bacterium]MED5292251.1 phosphotriesterase-related protein [Actinomycetota bacterium]
MTFSVETATGPIQSSELGRVLMHEHVFVISTEIQQNYPQEWGEEQVRIDDAIKRLNELKDSGIDTILDPTAIGLGRYIPRIQQVAKKIDLKIVCATGLYTFNELPHYYRRRTASDVDALTTHFVQDIVEGFADTGVKAGVIKCATDKPGLTPDVERVLRACAQAHRETGCPITTHTNAETERGLDQQRIFDEEGVDLSRVVIGHCGDTNDLDYLQRLLDAGSILGMDRFGIDGYLTTEQRVKVVAQLCEMGYSQQLVLSHDASCYIDWIEGEVPLAPLPNWHYLHISKDVIPALLEAGVSTEQIDTMLIDTPKQFLESRNLGGY